MLDNIKSLHTGSSLSWKRAAGCYTVQDLSWQQLCSCKNSPPWMREPAKATGKRQLVWSGPRPPGPPVWSLPRDTHICNSTYKHSTHSCMAQRRAPEVHWAQCQLCAYRCTPDVLCNYAQTQVGLVQPRSNLLFAEVPPRLLKELCDRLQDFWCTLLRAKAGRRKVR